MQSYRRWSLPGPLALPLPRPGTPGAARVYRSALAIVACAPAADRAGLAARLRTMVAPIAAGDALAAWAAVAAGRPGCSTAADAWLRAVCALAWP